MSFMGPNVPQRPHAAVSSTTENDAIESDEDDYTPALPPELVAARKVAGPSSKPTPGPSSRRSPSPSSTSLPPPPRRVIGPAFPSVRPTHDVNRASHSDSDAEVGPQPLPSHVLPASAEKSGVEAFLEREARRRKHVEEAQQPKKLVREEWMLVPPKAGDLLASLDPTKLKARQFGKGTTAHARDMDSSLWTETPAERQQRLADEVSGRKRRAANAEPVEDEEGSTKRRRRDAEIRKGVEAHTRHVRGPALVDVHTDREAQEKDGDAPPSAIWDHSRDMSLGGRLMDDKQRQKLLRDAKGLGDRFGTGKSGGFL